MSEIFKKKNPWLFLVNFTFSRPFWQKDLEEKTLNYKEPIIIEHLAFLSVKYNVYLSELYRALVSARVIGKSTCGNLTIEFRGIINDQVIFLITKANIVVAQFRVAEEFLFRKDISFESWLDTDKIRRQVSKQNIGLDFMSIQNLRLGMKKVNLKAEVLDINVPKIVNTQFGNRVKVTDVWIADETGKVKLCLWGEQLNLPIVGEMVQIKGASVRIFKREKLLSLGRFGTLSILRPLLIDNGNGLA